MAVVVSAVILIASAWPDMTSDNPLAGPLGYQNANGAFAVQALVAAAILVAASMSHLARAAAIAAVAFFAAVPFVIGSVGAAVSSVAVLAVGSLVILGWWRGWGTAALLGGTLAVLLGTVALGASYVPRQTASSGIVEEGLTETRLALWHDALAIAIAHPLTGVGPGRFIDVSQVASADPDTRHAHQEYLEMAAETGFVGGLLLVMLVGWAMIRTGRRGDQHRGPRCLCGRRARDPCQRRLRHAFPDHPHHDGRARRCSDGERENEIAIVEGFARTR